MGLDSSKANEESSRLSQSTYKAFNQDSEWYPPPFTVVRELRHFQEGDPQLDVSACAFPPNDDSVLVTLTTFPSVHRNFRAGYVQSWDLHDEGTAEEPEDACNDSLFTYAPRPTLSFSPEGDLIAVILNSGKGQLILVEKNEGNYLEPCKIDCRAEEGLGDASLCSRALCCVFSTDGGKAVTVTNATLHAYRPGRETHELCLWKVRTAAKLFQCVWRVSCEVVLPKFSGRLVSCIFSPDSSLLSLSTSVGQLYVLDTKSLELFAAIKTEMTFENKCISSFVPCVANQQLAAICCRLGTFQVWDLSANGVKCTTDTQITEDPHKITTFSFNLDGTQVAFGTSDAKVLVYKSEPFEFLFQLSPPHHTEEVVESGMSVHSLAFSRSCQELAVGYSKNYVRLWQLPMRLELQHMCRLTIIKTIPQHKLHQLPLPKSVIAYLLFTYFSVE